jgi:tetratricopeptide (TPR) repeat protein
MNHYARALALLGTTVLASPAWAGEEVIYQAAPAWVEPADVTAALRGSQDVVLLDRQRLLDGGTISMYEDVAVRLKTPEAVRQLNTLSIRWQPDKGDLLFHRLEIIRGEETIDVLAGGPRFDVLRRETGIERRELDGSLTATMSVPGLRQGDVLRIARTITLRDQALGDEMQLTDGLIAGTDDLGMARQIVSWPASQDLQWRAIGTKEIQAPRRVGDYQRIEVKLPLAKPAEMPEDSPLRFRINPLLQVGSFSSWSEVSAKLAPYFGTAGAIEPGGALSSKVAAIAAASPDPLVRAAQALQIVQDEISYLANGMDGGNYIPQKPEETWQQRFGDCKAKSLLLASMLRDMGIDAEVVVVSTTIGDAVVNLLPLPGAFNHMIVRARIDGADYWLDGTSSGGRLATIGEVPNFEYALPIVEGGADLQVIEPRWQTTPDRNIRLTYDFTGGVDMPAIYDMTIELNGIMAAGVRTAANERDAKKQREFVAGYVDDIFEDAYLIDGSVTYDESTGQGFVQAKGLYFDAWTLERGKWSTDIVLESTDLEFKPDRGRAAWKELPVQLGQSSLYREHSTVLLPDQGKGYRFAGSKEFSGVVAGRKVERRVEVLPGRIVFTDEVATVPTEIAPKDFAGERSRVASFRSGSPRIDAPEDVPFYWMLSDADFKKRTAHLEQAYSKIIEHNDDQGWAWALRGLMRALGPDKKGALADLTKAVEIEPSAERYGERSQVLAAMGRFEDALADAREAYDLKPEPSTAAELAQALASLGNFDEALALLEEQDVTGDERIYALQMRAEIAGEAGRGDEGWALLEEALGERPGNAEILNAQCWYSATWRYRLEDAPELCTRAVEASQWAASTLDSRALAYYRLGRVDDALADLNAALRNEPQIAASRYLRGLILAEQGVDGGRKDIEQAKRLSPTVEHTYRRYGVGGSK